jgi:hypothetical protein
LVNSFFIPDSLKKEIFGQKALPCTKCSKEWKYVSDAPTSIQTTVSAEAYNAQIQMGAWLTLSVSFYSAEALRWEALPGRHSANRNMIWAVMESAYSAADAALYYQLVAGVPSATVTEQELLDTFARNYTKLKGLRSRRKKFRV